MKTPESKEPTVGEFIRQLISDIVSGLPEGYELDSELDFELSIVTHSKSEGGINLSIVTGEYGKGKETTQTISFSIINPKQQERKAEQDIAAFGKGMGTFIEVLKEAGADEPKKLGSGHP